jgi:hypothetical protein
LVSARLPAGDDALDHAAVVASMSRPSRWSRRLDQSLPSPVTEIAEAERISKSYVSRILRLALLAPDLVEAILGGWAADQRVMLECLKLPLPAVWEKQRFRVGFD